MIIVDMRSRSGETPEWMPHGWCNVHHMDCEVVQEDGRWVLVCPECERGKEGDGGAEA